MIAQEIAAGRELDALVAEKVMGWISYVDGDEWTWGDPEGHDFPRVPPYSTDIAAAWLVLDKFTSYDLGYEGEVNGETSCTVGYWPGSKYVYAKATVRGNDAPLAICRAALKAIG